MLRILLVDDEPLVLIGLLFSGLREKNFITMSEEAQYYFDGSSSVRT